MGDQFPSASVGGVTVYVEAFDEAVASYTAALGPPAFVHGEGTRSRRLGSDWFTLLRGERGGAANVEMTIRTGSPAEAEALQRAFIDAGGTGSAPSDEVMHEPVRFCPVRDPFGFEILVIAPLGS